MTYPTHPAATIFPMMADEALRGLADDIKANGQHEPIELYDDQILDGRNRLAACALAEVDPEFRVLVDVDSPTAYVLSKNLHRRHLTTDQRAVIGAAAKPLFEAEAKERQRLSPGRPNRKGVAPVPHLFDGPELENPDRPSKISLYEYMTEPPPKPAPKSRDLAGQQVGVSGRTVDKASELLTKAPNLADKVMAGEQTLASAFNSVRRQEKEAERAALPPPPEIAERIEVANVAERIPLKENSVDLIVTSPPYGLDIAYHGGDIKAAAWTEFMADWLSEAYRVAKVNGGRLALNVPLDTSEPTYRPVYAETVGAAIGAGWTYRGTIVWDEGNSTKGNRGLGSVDSASAPHPIAQVEMVALFSRGTWKKAEPGVSDISHDEWQALGNGMWKFSGESRGWEGHPAAFPVELPRRLIKYLSYIGDTVMDPFCGSGTTVLVAKTLKREGVGFDISPEYVASAQRRLAAG